MDRSFRFLGASGKEISPSIPLLQDANGSLAINWMRSYAFAVTLSANLANVAFHNVLDGDSISVAVTNTAGNFTVNWGNSIKWVAATQPTQTTGAKTDVWTFVKIGSSIYGNAVQNLS